MQILIFKKKYISPVVKAVVHRNNSVVLILFHGGRANQWTGKCPQTRCGNDGARVYERVCVCVCQCVLYAWLKAKTHLGGNYVETGDKSRTQPGAQDAPVTEHEGQHNSDSRTHYNLFTERISSHTHTHTYTHGAPLGRFPTNVISSFHCLVCFHSDCYSLVERSWNCSQSQTQTVG